MHINKNKNTVKLIYNDCRIDDYSQGDNKSNSMIIMHDITFHYRRLGVSG